MSDRPISPFRDAQQARIHRRLSRVGPGAQAFYEDACALMGRQPPLATTTLCWPTSTPAGSPCP